MSASTEATIHALVDRFPQLAPVLEEHLEDLGELLPHLVMSDVIRWLAARVDDERALCGEVMSWLEDEFERGPEDVEELIVVSGVEMLPDPGHPGSALRDLLGPARRKYDPWLV